MKQLMNKKIYVSGIVVIVLLVGLFSYSKSNMTCKDGYGTELYVLKTELVSKLNSAQSNSDSLDVVINKLDKIASQSHKCGNTNYSVKDGDILKVVNYSDFQTFIGGKLDLYKISQSGNGPYLVNDLTGGTRYLISQKNGKYVLMQSTKNTASTQTSSN